MSISPKNIIPILVIEDNDEHYDAIKAVLREENDCNVFRQTTHNEERLYNYKSDHPDS